MKIATAFILLLLQLAHSVEFPNCDVVHLSQRICLLCNPNFELDKGKCERCLPGFILLKDKCESMAVPIADNKDSKPTVPVSILPSQVTTINSDISSSVNFTPSDKSTDKPKILPSGSVEENPQLQSLLKSPGFESYLLSLIQQYNSRKTQQPCLFYLNGKDICAQCASDYHLVNGLCFFNIMTPLSVNNRDYQTTNENIIPIASPTTSSTSTTTQVFLPFYLNTPIKFIVGMSNTDNSSSNDTVQTTTNSTTTTTSVDPNCKTLGNQSCSECYSFFYYNNTLGRCFATNPLCKTVTSENLCITCYEGYSPREGNCILDIILQAIDNSNANRYQPAQQTTQANSTLPSSPLQTDRNNTEQPTTGTIPVTPSTPSPTLPSQVVPLCSDHNQSGCISCSQRYYLKDGFCNLVDNQCSNWTPDGICLQCYTGYTAVNGTCQVLSEIPPEKQPISFACAYRTVEINKFCIRVSDDCATWSETDASCTSCYQGYGLVNGVCQRNAF